MSREFYPPELTDQSRRVLDKVLATVPDAVLIGGWGTWAHLGSMPSHDVDLMVDHTQLDLLRTRFGEITASTHVGGRKWRGSVEGIHLDLYVPYQSRLGQALQLRVERLTTASELVGGRRVLPVPVHVATKLAALLDRPESLPGQKDREEIWALAPRAEPEELATALRASARPLEELARLVDTGLSYLEDLDLGRAERRHLRQWRLMTTEVVAARKAGPTANRDKNRDAHLAELSETSRRRIAAAARLGSPPRPLPPPPDPAPGSRPGPDLDR